MEKDKYYVPDIEDFRIGYEFEFQGIPKGWHKMTFSEENSLKNMRYNIEKLKDAVRVPYLTQEQIETEGWNNTGKSIDDWFEKEGTYERSSWTSYKAIMHYGFHDKLLTISLSDPPDREIIFSGYCKSINEFRYICKLLKI